jgi:hypothetical protein
VKADIGKLMSTISWVYLGEIYGLDAFACLPVLVVVCLYNIYHFAFHPLALLMVATSSYERRYARPGCK